MNLFATAPDWIVWLLVASLAGAAVQDAVQLKISNWITLCVLGLAVAAIALTGVRVELWENGVVFAIVLVIGIALFSRQVLGGGDVKLFSAVALWTDFDGALPLIASILLCGGLLALFILFLRAFSWKRIAAHVKTLQPRSGIPYGIAIAAGSILMVTAFSGEAQKPSLSTMAPLPKVPN